MAVIFLNFAERPKSLFKETIMLCHLCHSTFQCNAMHGIPRFHPLLEQLADTISHKKYLSLMSAYGRVSYSLFHMSRTEEYLLSIQQPPLWSVDVYLFSCKRIMSDIGIINTDRFYQVTDFIKWLHWVISEMCLIIFNTCSTFVCLKNIAH